MAEKDIKLRIDAAVESADAAKSLGQLRKALLEIQELQSQVGNTSGENFDKLSQASTNASQKLAETRDAIGDIQDRTRTLEGTPIERLTGSFGLLKESVLNLDFDKAKIGAEGLLNTFTPVVDGKLVTGFGGIGGALGNLGGAVKGLGSTFMSLGKALLTNPIFLLATIITLIVVAVIKLLDSLGLLKPILDAIKAAIGFVVDAFKALTDWLGLTTNAANDYAEQTLKNGEDIKKAIQDEGAEREKLLGLVEGLTDEEIAAIEKKTGIQIANEKSVFDVKQDTLMATQEQLDVEINALRAIEEAGGELTEEQQKELDKRLDDYKKNNAAIRENEIAKNAAIVQMNKTSSKTLRDLQLRNVTDELEKNKKLLEINKDKEIADIEAQIVKAKKLGASTKDLEAAKVEIEKFYNNEAKKVQAAKVKEDADRAKEANDNYKSGKGKELKSLIDSEKAKVVLTEEGSKARLDAEIVAINKVEDFQKKNRKALELSEAQLTIIIQENIDKRAKLNETYNKNVLDAANKVKLTEAEIEVLRATTEEQRLNATLKQVEAERDIKLSSAELTADERTKIELEASNQIKEINTQLTDLEVANNQKILDSATTVANTKLSQAEFDAARTEGTFAEEAAEIDNIKNLQLEALEAERLAKLNNTELSEAEIAAIEEEYRQGKKEAEETAFEATKELTEKTRLLKIKEFSDAAEWAQKGATAVQGISDVLFAFKKNKAEKGSKEEEAIARKQFKVNKALQLGMAVIDGFKSITTSLAQAPIAIGPIPNPAGIASLAFAAITTATNIAKIAASKFESSSAPTPPATPDVAGGGGEGGTAASSFSPTQFFGLGQGSAQGGGNGAGATKVYVTETDITNTQNKVKVIENRAVIG